MQNVHGILLVIAAMAGFTIEDTLIKRMSQDIPVGQILIIIGLSSTLLFAFMARHRGHAIFARAAWRPMFLWRALAEAMASMAFVTSLSLVDISVVAAVFQATPLVITMGAALFLGEDVGWRRWSAIAIGFIGVLIIIRPGVAGFEPAALIVLISVCAIAARDLITRRMDTNVSSFVIAFQGSGAVIPAGFLLLALAGEGPQTMTATHGTMMLVAIAVGALSYYGIVQAMRLGEAAAVTPFRYTRLLFSLIVGVTIFGEHPDTLTLAGAALIIATGLYTFIREQRLARRQRRDLPGNPNI
ncbi:DMT family transporter [Roseovarius indicus]|uniref:Carboxylate/amino acid/amine transporter n=1 Tax=Roseovarius indicus TaxID=540747 RepID=A0A0T5PA08_9RHOB|nr:DMT family transporter [Roseovarius indicus]KRS17941.1 membrane protein [Roseovarius indicus]QEW27243.1 carboxylate/amino acid/amine transporter [Roseovarius indicus]SFD51693.1 Permease of the drug/metabolite transporter (DMT) superfamily [Roseovarius indicus]